MSRIRAAGADVYVDQSTNGAGSASPLRYASNWTMDASTDLISVTAFGDSNEVTIPALSKANGTVKGFYDDTSTTGSGALFAMATSGVARKSYWYAKAPSTSGPYWHGAASWSVSYEFDIAGAASFSGTWSAASAINFVG